MCKLSRERAVTAATHGVSCLEEDGPEVSLWCGSIMANVKQQHRPRPQLLMSADVMQSGFVGQSIQCSVRLARRTGQWKRRFSMKGNSSS